ncbi:MAG: hypothetical protein HQL45_17510 [Alphaproteobacteria bacterium]|nr:hypothetical protein [Alphaproteobacteria bacterium]
MVAQDNEKSVKTCDFEKAVTLALETGLVSYLVLIPLLSDGHFAEPIIWIVERYEEDFDPSNPDAPCEPYPAVGFWLLEDGAEEWFSLSDLPETVKLANFKPAPDFDPLWMDYELPVLLALLSGLPLEEAQDVESGLDFLNRKAANASR